MTEKQRKYESEVRLVKPQKLVPEPKHEEFVVHRVNVNLTRVQRTFSRETVIRLIEWFKQD